MNYITYMMSCNFAIHATCLLALTTYKYNELQVFSTTQKLSCKANYKTPFFSYCSLRAYNFLCTTNPIFLHQYVNPFQLSYVMHACKVNLILE